VASFEGRSEGAQMPPARFSFSGDRIVFLSTILKRVKPRLSDEQIKGFIRECQIEIAWVLSGYPNGFCQADDDSELLKAIAEAAYRLNSSLRRLDRGTMFALSVRVLNEPDRGLDASAAREYAASLDHLLERIRDQAMDLKDGPGTPISVRASEELAQRIAGTYVHFFGALPSLRHDSPYKAFIDEITANDLPENFRMRIGKRQMDLANRRAYVQLECMLLNKTATETSAKQGENEHG